MPEHPSIKVRETNPSEEARERRDREDREAVQRTHEMELEKIRHPQSQWPEAVRDVLVWGLVLAAICYAISIGWLR